MPRPRIFRKISQEPQIRCFKPEKDDLDSIEPIEITIDEFEAIRLRDYHDIQQKKAAQIMEISQPTFHRALTSARKKISKALIEGSTIMIVGEGYITDNEKYKCKTCGFRWNKGENKYIECPQCKIENMEITLEDEEFSAASEVLERRSYGGPGVGAGPPRVCKCPQCGYESPKEQAVPCKNIKCPQCETPLCGVD